MTTLLMNIVQATFKPSFVALTLSMGVAIVSLDTNQHRVSQDKISLGSLGCQGVLSPICNAF